MYSSANPNHLYLLAPLVYLRVPCLGHSIYYINLYYIHFSSIFHSCFPHSALKQFADNTQLFIALSNFESDTWKASIQSALVFLYSLFSHNSLSLNPEKCDEILLGTSKHNESLINIASVDISGTCVTLSDHVNFLGVTLV